MTLSIKSMPANHGDCFIIKDLSEDLTFIIDCGLKITYNNYIKKECSEIEALILTHIDEDHILGAIPLFNDIPKKIQLNNIYFNSPHLLKSRSQSGEISVKQAKEIDRLLVEKNINCLGLTCGDYLPLSKNISLSLLSPLKSHLSKLNEKKFIDKESQDTKVNISILTTTPPVEELTKLKDDYLSINSDLVNACSTAFLLNYKEKRMLFLADAHPEVIANSLEKMGFSAENKIQVDLVKLSHHGSYKSISNRLLSLISCTKYWVSTNGGKSTSKHPSPATLAKIAANSYRGEAEHIHILFNYPIKTIESRNGPLMSEDDKKNYQVIFEEVNEVTWS